MRIPSVKKDQLAGYLQRQRQTLQESDLPEPRRGQAIRLVERDLALLQGARGETVEQMRANLALGRSLVHGAALTIGAGAVAGACLALTGAISGRDFSLAFAGLGALGVATMAVATFGVQKPAVGEVLDSLDSRIQSLQAIAVDSRHQVEELLQPAPVADIQIDDEGVQLGDVFLPIERDNSYF
ncbi:MAG: hypothetical protein AB7S38_35270 [Vulcanimicrobiota bacterium]